MIQNKRCSLGFQIGAEIKKKKKKKEEGSLRSLTWETGLGKQQGCAGSQFPCWDAHTARSWRYSDKLPKDNSHLSHRREENK